MSSPEPRVRIRRARLSDVQAIAALSWTVFGDTPFTDAVHPHRHKYRADFERVHYQNAMSRFLNVAGESWVACRDSPSSDDSKKENGGSSSGSVKEEAVGYIQFVRIGKDDSAGMRRQMSRRGLEETGLPLEIGAYLLVLVAWIHTMFVSVQKRLMPDRSQDLSVLQVVGEDGKQAKERYDREFPERWHATTLAVDKKWQGKGIGRRLMEKVIEQAKSEGVAISLSSSPEGEALYRKLGFELLGRFQSDVAGDAADAGGWFVWRPR